MKKVIVLVLSLIFVVCLVAYINTLPRKQSLSNGDSHSDVEGIFVEIVGINIYPDITSLVVLWNNKTEYTATYGNTYSIERLENGEWVDCSLKDNIFTLIGYELKTNETVNKEYRLTDMYDISKSGTYRFRTTCILDKGDNKECNMWAEFIIE